jgi:RimJ/RimL family protein N-acetyltransferase
MDAFGDSEIQRWHMRRIDDEQEALGWINGWADRWANETDAGWAVTRADGQAIGQVSLRSIMLEGAQAQLSYWVVPSARGAGIAARAAATAARWAFDALGMHRLYLVHSTANSRSCKVASRAGFRIEGTLGEYMLHADGWHDVHLHARLRTDERP